MRLGLLFAAAVTLGWLSVSAPAQACKCAMREPADYYRGADHALHVRVVEVVQQNEFAVTYRAELLEDDFKGCLKAHSLVLLNTAGSSASCGVMIPVDGEALVFAQRIVDEVDEGDEGAREAAPQRDADGLLALDIAPIPGQPALTTNTCSGTRAWAQVSAQTRDFLATQPKRCGGAQTCEGKGVVQCFVDPCQVSQCDVRGAVCQSSYCGGCNARWFAPSGAQVCAPKPACRYDDPARRYVARSPQQCQLVKFACQPGEEMFFDGCGCGCARR